MSAWRTVGMVLLFILLLGSVDRVLGESARQEPPAAPHGMALIPAGSFRMGDAFGEGAFDELPVCDVYVSAFYMDLHEVTKALWDDVAAWAAANGYDIGPEDGLGKGDDHPVTGVTWYEAAKWANARSEKEGLAPCYFTDDGLGEVYRGGYRSPSNDCVRWGADGYRLPTEAEWEKAARGGCEGRRFPWCDADDIQHERANYYSEAYHGYDTSPTRGDHPTYAVGEPPHTSPVGSFAANGYGLYDLAGNVLEWCWDVWQWGEPYPSSPVTDPRGPSVGLHRMLRGGGWSSGAGYCRAAFRGGSDPLREMDCLGFRLVRAVPDAAGGPGSDLRMVRIPAGWSVMGNAFGDPTSEPPARDVLLAAFWIDVHEVTKALWDEVAAWAAANGYDIEPGDGFGKGPEHPVTRVSWYEAVKWANARSEKEGLTPCYCMDTGLDAVYRAGTLDLSNGSVRWDANGYRLPTEAEWEKAARGGCERRRFSWCDADVIDHDRANYYSDAYYDYDVSETRGDHPAFAVGGFPYTSPVGSFAGNGYGLHDMAGNVLEWCWDWHAAEPAADPRGPASGTHRIDRGGSWYHDASRCPVARRHWLDPVKEEDTVGFRLVRAAP